MVKVDYFFDFLSPYSYFSWFKLTELRESNKEIELKIYPVFLGLLLKHWGQKGPGEIEPKRNYLLRDCLRYSSQNGIPFQWPKRLPFNSMYALRLCLKEIAKENQIEFISMIWRACWQRGEDIGNPDHLASILNDQGYDGELYLEKACERSSRKLIEHNIQVALKSGVFGVPSMVVNGELFWGKDSFGNIQNLLMGKDLLDRKLYNSFLLDHPMP